MDQGLTATVDTSQFNRALKLYRQNSNKTWPVILNTKGFFISLRWFQLTKKADRGAIERSIGKIVTVQAGIISRGKRKGQVKHVKDALAVRADTNPSAPLAALIINKRRAARAMPGLQGPKMKAAIIKMIGSRNRAIGFLAAGILPAIRIFGPLAQKAGAPMADRSAARQTGIDKGSAIPATEAKPEAWIINSASTKRDRKNALPKYSGPAQAQAVAEETASMLAYCERKLKPHADQFNKH
jgi:hypothetical protein